MLLDRHDTIVGEITFLRIQPPEQKGEAQEKVASNTSLLRKYPFKRVTANPLLGPQYYLNLKLFISNAHHTAKTCWAKEKPKC